MGEQCRLVSESWEDDKITVLMISESIPDSDGPL